MRHEQAAQLAARLLGASTARCCSRRTSGDRIVVARDLALAGQTRLSLDQIGLLVRGGLDFVGRALREQQRVLQRFFHRLEMADALFEVGDLRFERGAVLRFVFQRLDDLVEELSTSVRS